MDNLPEVQFKLAWQTYRVGDRIRPPAGLRDWLLAAGYIEEIEVPARPAKLTRQAAAKLVDGTKKLFGGDA